MTINKLSCIMQLTGQLLLSKVHRPASKYFPSTQALCSEVQGMGSRHISYWTQKEGISLRSRRVRRSRTSSQCRRRGQTISLQLQLTATYAHIEEMETSWNWYSKSCQSVYRFGLYAISGTCKIFSFLVSLADATTVIWLLGILLRVLKIKFRFQTKSLS